VAIWGAQMNLLGVLAATKLLILLMNIGPEQSEQNSHRVSLLVETFSLVSYHFSWENIGTAETKTSTVNSNPNPLG